MAQTLPTSASSRQDGMTDFDASHDPRVAAFCSREGPEVFHPVAHRHEIWRADPLDVETIHEEARSSFQRLVNRATTPPGLNSGRILLLKGEAGCGKTHLMRAFRNWAHTRRLGYCGYMQMTSASDAYGRYALNNLLDSLDQPYNESLGETSGLMRLSTALAETDGRARASLARLREDELSHDELAALVDELADGIVMDDRFDTVDYDIVRVMLYLQRDDPRVKSRVLKYLRCEYLAERDRRVLGGISPRFYADASQRVIALLGGLMWAVDSASLILCVDQLEDMYNLDDAQVKFRRAMATLCDLADRVPSSVIVISCLEDFYDKLRAYVTQSVLDRVENDPPPIVLKANRDADEIVELVSYRLRHLYETLDVSFRDDQPTFPIASADLTTLTGHRTRHVLHWCHNFRERCASAGALVRPDGQAAIDAPPPPTATSLEPAWNDFRSSFKDDIPVEDNELAALLARAIETSSGELATGHWFSTEANGRFVTVEVHAPDDSVDRLIVGVCNRSAKCGGLSKQVTELSDRASEHTPRVIPVIVRSTEFPSDPKSQIARQIGTFLTRGGRRAVVEDSDWRTFLAFQRFRALHASDTGFADWVKQERPLSRLKSLRVILDLDNIKPARPRASSDAPVISVEPMRITTKARASLTVADGEPIVVGTTTDRAGGPVILDRSELTRHAAFLGGSGSGKTTVALNIVEQLLLRGVPAILIDRKGDLCGYARELETSEESLQARRQSLVERVEVALYTPGNPNGRPLSIAIVPAGLGALPAFDREQVSRYAASALGGMMNYKAGGGDPSRLAILANALNLLSQFEPDAPVTVGELIRFIDEADPSLVNAVGKLDTKLFAKLVQDLETLRLTRGELLNAEGERLDAEALLGLGPHATPGRTRLSIVSTKFLGGNQDVRFWVSQLLMEMSRWASRSPSSALQAVLMFDEADLYLPAQSNPPTKEPMENLLKRARSAGLGLMLATQSPGDFDYKCRDTIRTWFVGKIKEQTSLAKMKPMLSDCRVDIAARLPGQAPGEFHLLRDGLVSSLKASLCAVAPQQVPEDEILVLARRTRKA
jgi:DNA helicase HerA-like ATPase